MNPERLKRVERQLSKPGKAASPITGPYGKQCSTNSEGGPHYSQLCIERHLFDDLGAFSIYFAFSGSRA